MKFGVQSADVRTPAAHVRLGAADVADTLRKLSAEISALASSWEGDAYNAFHEHWTHWQAGADQIHQAMDEMGNFLEQAATQYESAEQNIASAARS